MVTTLVQPKSNEQQAAASEQEKQTTVSQGLPSIESSATKGANPPTTAPSPNKTLPKPLALGSRGPRLHGIDPSLPANKQKVIDAIEQYLIVRPQAPGARYNYEIVCCECGWHTHSVSLENGKATVREHVQRHLYQQ